MTKIENAILEEAAKRAQAFQTDAEKEIETIKEAGQAEREAFLAEESETAEAIYREQVRRHVANAGLDAKKILLGKKKETLDEIYRLAMEEIQKLPKERYLAVMKGLLAEAENGDVAVVNAADAKKLTPEWWQVTVKELGIDVKLSETSAEIAGGVLLKGGQTDKNLSLESEMALFREETEMDLAKRLFGDKK